MKDYTKFILDGYEALIERGVITREQLKPSTVTDEQITAFEKEMGITLPDIIKAYLKAYCHEIGEIQANIPIEDIDDMEIDVVKQICLSYAEEIAELDEDEQPYVEKWWCGLLSVPEMEPLSVLKDMILGLREFADLSEQEDITSESVKHLLPVADWMTAGPLCIDTTIEDCNVNLEDTSTWQLRWFDHEEFDWEFSEYIDNIGNVTGRTVLPNFEAFFQLYFYGIYDSVPEED